jgi:hypothetical protein
MLDSLGKVRRVKPQAMPDSCWRNFCREWLRDLKEPKQGFWLPQKSPAQQERGCGSQV